MDGVAELSTVFLYFRNSSEALFSNLNERADVVSQSLAKRLFTKSIKCVDGEAEPVTIQ